MSLLSLLSMLSIGGQDGTGKGRVEWRGGRLKGNGVPEWSDRERRSGDGERGSSDGSPAKRARPKTAGLSLSDSLCVRLNPPSTIKVLADFELYHSSGSSGTRMPPSQALAWPVLPLSPILSSLTSHNPLTATPNGPDTTPVPAQSSHSTTLAFLSLSLSHILHGETTVILLSHVNHEMSHPQ